MINVLVSGCNGRMGQEVIKQMDFYHNLILSCGFDMKDERLNTFPVYSNINEIQEPVDIIIDFSNPVCTLNILKYGLSTIPQ